MFRSPLKCSLIIALLKERLKEDYSRIGKLLLFSDVCFTSTQSARAVVSSLAPHVVEPYVLQLMVASLSGLPPSLSATTILLTLNSL